MSHNRRKVRWYRLAPVRISCNACGAEVRGHVANGMWIALTMWVALAAGAAFGFGALKEYGVISGNAVQVLALGLLVFYSGACVFSVFFSYKVVTHAP